MALIGRGSRQEQACELDCGKSHSIGLSSSSSRYKNLSALEKVIPFSCYPQFRLGSVQVENIHAAWRETAILGNRTSISVMPLLTDELIFQSFAEHELLWNDIGCDIYVRGNHSSLTDLVIEHEDKYETVKGSLKQRLERARYLERAHGRHLRKAFDGQSAQLSFRDTVVEMVRLAAKKSRRDTRQAAVECISEIRSHPSEILDWQMTLDVVRRCGLGSRYQALPRLAYFYVGASSFGASPLIPSQDAHTMPEAFKTDIVAGMIRLAHINAMNIRRISPVVLADLPLDVVLRLSKSRIARSFSSKLGRLVREQESLYDPDASRKIAENLIAEFAQERRVERIFSAEGYVLDALAALSLTSAALSFFDYLALIPFSITTLSFFFGKLLPTPTVTYLDKIQDLVEAEAVKKVSH